jgi:ATP-dependent DNA ligase
MANTILSKNADSRPGNDLIRRFPLIVETLARLRSRSCIIDGEAVCHACKLGLEGIVSKRLGSPYRVRPWTIHDRAPLTMATEARP